MVRTIFIVLVFCGILLLGGCPAPDTAAPTGTEATFAPGTGADFGMINDAKGNTFQVVERSDGSVRVVANGVDGHVEMIVDSLGRLTSAIAGNGNELNFLYNTDGSVDVTGVILVDGRSEPFAGTIPAGTLPPTGKPLLTAQSDPLIVCVVVQLFCSSLQDIIDWIIQENIGMFVAQLSPEVRFFLPDPERITFPTGIGPVDGGIRAQVRAAFPVIVQLEGFCTVWELLDLDDFCESA
ncbi:MAG: hypothetical protein AB7N71_01385 [Phycisphaerae bacterium]